jgi:OOP family OmpA-OmpF porin
VIDDVFLLHRDGLLIRHFTRKLNPEVDSDILGGMLIAVQNFVNESFASDKGLATEGGLDELKFGKYSILIARGKHVVMAAVVLGGKTVNTVKEIKAAIEDLERNLGKVLEKWSGDMGQVETADKYMQDLLAGKYKGKAKSP